MRTAPASALLILALLLAGCSGGPVGQTDGVFEPGDTGPGGGVVFYVDAAGFSCGTNQTRRCTYLEMAPAEAGTDLPWSNGSWPQWSWETETCREECNWDDAVNGADDSAVGAGFQNTTDIVNQRHNTASAAAAVYADGYSNNGYTDWFLPSRDELDRLCAYLHQAASGSTTQSSCTEQADPAHGIDGVYWSSSEVDGRRAWLQRFESGVQLELGKFIELRAVPIRAG